MLLCAYLYVWVSEWAFVCVFLLFQQKNNFLFILEKSNICSCVTVETNDKDQLSLVYSLTKATAAWFEFRVRNKLKQMPHIAWKSLTSLWVTHRPACTSPAAPVSVPPQRESGWRSSLGGRKAPHCCHILSLSVNIKATGLRTKWPINNGLLTSGQSVTLLSVRNGVFSQRCIKAFLDESQVYFEPSFNDWLLKFPCWTQTQTHTLTHLEPWMSSHSKFILSSSFLTHFFPFSFI